MILLNGLMLECRANQLCRLIKFKWQTHGLPLNILIFYLVICCYPFSNVFVLLICHFERRDKQSNTCRTTNVSLFSVWLFTWNRGLITESRIMHKWNAFVLACNSDSCSRINARVFCRVNFSFQSTIFHSKQTIKPMTRRGYSLCIWTPLSVCYASVHCEQRIEQCNIWFNTFHIH